MGKKGEGVDSPVVRKDGRFLAAASEDVKGRKREIESVDEN